MSDPIVTGLRLLRAVFDAQRAVDALAPYRYDDRHASAHRRLTEAKTALAEFETSLEARDWKAQQAGS